MGVSAKNKAAWGKTIRFCSYRRVCLTVVLLSCIQVNDVHVFQCLTFNDTEERIRQKCNRTKKQQKEEENGWVGTDKFSVYYSVVDTCCQMLHIAMVISKNKMWETVCYTQVSGSFFLNHLSWPVWRVGKNVDKNVNIRNDSLIWKSI